MWLNNSAANTAQLFVRTQGILLNTFVKVPVVPQVMVPGRNIKECVAENEQVKVNMIMGMFSG